MAIPHSELQKINPSSIIELFELELVEGTHYATGNPSNVPTIYRFHSGVNNNTYANIIWQSNTYERLSVEAKGYEYSGKGKLPRPNIFFSNISGITRSGTVIRMTDLLISVNAITPHNDLINAKVTRIMTTASNLDAANFSGNTNPFGTPSNDQFPQEIHFIDRKVQEGRDVIQFELVSSLDTANIMIPKRQVTRKDFEGIGTFRN